MNEKKAVLLRTPFHYLSGMRETKRNKSHDGGSTEEPRSIRFRKGKHLGQRPSLLTKEDTGFFER